MSEDRWIPLEANPEVMDAFIHRLGVNDKWTCADVYSLDEEMLMMVPRPVLAVFMVYPITDKSETELIGKYSPNETDLKGGKLYFMQQTIGNACGTVALVHAVANNCEQLGVDPNSTFGKFIDGSKTLPPIERCKLLGSNKALSDAHGDLSVQGQSDVPPPETCTNLHFVAFINHNGTLYEMDGRKEAPVQHRPTTSDTVLEDTVAVVKQFIERDPKLITFSLIALCQA